MNLVYINPGDCSVIEAQVFSLLEYYISKKDFENIILLQGYKSLTERRQLEKKLNNLNVKIIWFKVYYDYPIIVLLSYLSLSRILKSLKLKDNTIIHIRGDLFGYLTVKYYSRIRQAPKILIDIRGLVMEEINFYLKNRILRYIKKRLFDKVFKGIKSSVEISVVSDAFKDYLISNFNFDRRLISVHSNITSSIFSYNEISRRALREELSIPENRVVAICSSGGGETWQKDYEIIKALVDSNIVVINLSTRKVDLDGVINRYVPFQSVPDYLSAADIGVLWRDKTCFNWVASPSKFSEFVASGLYVIHNGSIKIAMDYIKKFDAGININDPCEVYKNSLLCFKSEKRREMAATGHSVFGIECIGGMYIEKYKNMVSSNTMK